MATGFGFISTAPMHAQRTGAVAVTLEAGTKILVTGGTLDGPVSADLYDSATGAWTASQMTNDRFGHTATLLPSGHVLVIGGDNQTRSTAEVYDPATNAWQKVFNNLTAPRRWHTATLLPNGTVLVTGGVGVDGDGFGALASAEIFNPLADPVNGYWNIVPSMSVARANHSATALPDGTVLVAGGSNGNLLGTAELFDPAVREWRPTASLNAARSSHTATLLKLSLTGNFVVLVAGGVTAGNTTVSEQYQPNSLVLGTEPNLGPSGAGAVGASWIKVGAMNSHRTSHTATALPVLGVPTETRQVLVTGGLDPTSQLPTYKTTEIYDAHTLQWRAAGDLTVPRSLHTAALLNTGKVLIAGGEDASAEIGSRATTSATASGS